VSPLRIPAELEEQLARTPTDPTRRLRERVFNAPSDLVVRATDWLDEQDLPVTSANIADRRATLRKARPGRQPGHRRHSRRPRPPTPRKTVKDETVNTVPPGGITRELVEEAYNCSTYDWPIEDETGLAGGPDIDQAGPGSEEA
jgi:hypothetical protein